MSSKSCAIQLHKWLDWAELSHKPTGLHKREATQYDGPEPNTQLAMVNQLLIVGLLHCLPTEGRVRRLLIEIDLEEIVAFNLTTAFAPH